MKLLRRMLFWLLALIVGLALFLVVLIVVDGFFGGGRLDALTNLSIPAADGTPIRAHLAQPAGPGPHPAVILIHEFYGLRPDIVEKAEALAQQGYVVIAPNLFRGGTTGWIPRAIYNVITADTNQIDGDLAAVYAWLTEQNNVQADRVAVMGFCFGGGTALRYSLSNNQLAATVIFYGQPITDPAKLQALSGPVLGVFGGADVSIPVTEVDALRTGLDAAGVPHEITVYDGQPHAFVGGMEQIAAGGAPQAAWNQLLAFLQTHLQNGRGATPTQSLTVAEAAEGEPIWPYLLRLAWSHLGHL
jgi:carboxymethylenebutenolidase